MIVLGPQELNHFPLHLNSKVRTQPHNRHYVHLNIQLLYYNLLWTRGKGVAVYAYFILANRIDSTTTLTNLSLTLDNEFVGTFKHIPANTTDIEYNSPIHVNETLENKQHTLVIPLHAARARLKTPTWKAHFFYLIMWNIRTLPSWKNYIYSLRLY